VVGDERACSLVTRSADRFEAAAVETHAQRYPEVFRLCAGGARPDGLWPTRAHTETTHVRW
jgi:hypothetical protein